MQITNTPIICQLTELHWNNRTGSNSIRLNQSYRISASSSPRAFCSSCPWDPHRPVWSPWTVCRIYCATEWPPVVLSRGSNHGWVQREMTRGASTTSDTDVQHRDTRGLRFIGNSRGGERIEKKRKEKTKN